MQNEFRLIEIAYFAWRDGHNTAIESTLHRRESDCLITLTLGQVSYELTVCLNGRIDVTRNGAPAGVYELECVMDVEAILYSVTFPLLQSQPAAPAL